MRYQRFTSKTSKGRTITTAEVGRTSAVILNFVSPECPFCKQQLPVIESVASKMPGRSYRYINVSPALSAALIKRSPTAEWIEDGDGQLRQLFHVTGFPTMFVLKENGKIADVVSGVPDTLKDTLLTNLGNGGHHDAAGAKISALETIGRQIRDLHL